MDSMISVLNRADDKPVNENDSSLMRVGKCEVFVDDEQKRTRSVFKPFYPDRHLKCLSTRTEARRRTNGRGGPWNYPSIRSNTERHLSRGISSANGSKLSVREALENKLERVARIYGGGDLEAHLNPQDRNLKASINANRFYQISFKVDAI